MLKFCVMLVATIGSIACTPVATPTQRGDQVENTSEANKARDGNIAIQEEYDAALAKNTMAAYELFIARHPTHPLTAEAKSKLAGLASKNSQNPR